MTHRPESSRAEGDRWQLNGQAGPDGASAGGAGSEAGEDGKGGRRQKKKERHRERRRAAREREKRDRDSGRRHHTDVQSSDTDAVVSWWVVIDDQCSVLRCSLGAAPSPRCAFCSGTLVDMLIVLALVLEAGQAACCATIHTESTASRPGRLRTRTASPVVASATGFIGRRRASEVRRTRSRRNLRHLLNPLSTQAAGVPQTHSCQATKQR